MKLRVLVQHLNYSLTLFLSRDMSVFTKRTNPVTGRSEWELQDEDYDFHQEIARSAFADMLHDTERNQKYYVGVKLAIEKIHQMGKKAHVLDIGTGTGLLSMMAAKCGADTIVACEAFQPMAECAKKVISKNGFADKIKVISKRSTELTVGEDGDMEHRANVLVTEVFDTELIGEGAIGTFSHAHAHLLEKDCIVVPSSGTLYAHVVESGLAQKWNKLQPITDCDNNAALLLDTPVNIENCPGAAAVHDIQLSQFSQEEFSTIISPQPVFRFDWSGKTPFPHERSTIQVLKAERDGTAQVVFVWWDLTMDTEGQVVLSCAPVWAHPLTVPHAVTGSTADKLPWRDHWMQAIYYLPKEVHVKQGEELSLISCHDEYSLWFNLRKDLRITESDYLRPVCDCGLHVVFSRTRIGAMNVNERNSKYLAALNACVTQDSVCVCLSDGTLLGLAAAKFGAKLVYCIESNILAKHVLESFIKHNNLEDQVVIVNSITDILKKEELKKQVTVVLGEPHFFSTILPWQNIYFWYMKDELSNLLSDLVITLPLEATVWAMAVEFKDLWKIRTPLHVVEGFTITDFDKLIESSSTISDSAVEAQPLWEYPCRVLSQPFQVMEFSFTEEMAHKNTEKKGEVNFEGCGVCHGVVLWVDWDLDGCPKHSISTGPIEPVHINSYVKWDMHTRQGVYFLPTHQEIGTKHSLTYSVKFQPFNGDVQFNFDVISKS